MIIEVINDPGHAWAKVKLLDVIKAGVADQISNYSFALGIWAYLEEDCDMHPYFNALRKQGHIIEFKKTHVKSFDRSEFWRWYDAPVQKFIADNS